jgi:hypothetical protein
VAAADFLLACDLTTGAPRATVTGAAEPMVGGGVYVLAGDSRGRADWGSSSPRDRGTVIAVALRLGG